MTVRIVIGALLALAGCSGTTAPLPYQAVYVDLVWRQMYGMADHDPPLIEWIPSASWDVAGRRYDGFTWAGWKVQVASGENGAWPIEGTGLAHELMHMRTYDRTGDVDAFHYRGDWDLVGRAETAGMAVIGDLRDYDKLGDR